MLKHDDESFNQSFLVCIFNWFHTKVKFKELPLFTVWEVWKSRNKCIFEDKNPSSCHICTRLLCSLNEFSTYKHNLKHNVIRNPVIGEDVSTCYVDGAPKDGLCEELSPKLYLVVFLSSEPGEPDKDFLFGLQKTIESACYTISHVYTPWGNCNKMF